MSAKLGVDIVGIIDVGAGSRRQSGAQVMSFIVELFQFMRARKKLWMAPLLIVMLLLGGLIVLTKGSAIAPFIYTIF